MAFVTADELRALLQDDVNKRRRGEPPDNVIFDVLEAIKEVNDAMSHEERMALMPLMDAWFACTGEALQQTHAELDELFRKISEERAAKAAKQKEG